jgi:uncharacterized protein YdaU (DUF1376 family)
MMSGSSWFPFFGRDFLTATSGWTAEERGHYITLLIVQWEQKALVDDLARLELVSPGVTRCWDVVSQKFPLCSDGKRRNIRLEHERSKSHDRSERARQSASARWASAPVSGGDQGDGEPPNANAMRTHMPEQCERICTSNAPMSMSMNGSSSSAQACAWEELWPKLRQSWNAGVGVKWRTSRPSDTVKAALSEGGWLDDAIKAIEHLPKCRYFDDPVTLNQFCKPGFVDEVLNGKWDNPKKRKGGDFSDAPPPPRVFAGTDAARFAATLAREKKLKEESA